MGPSDKMENENSMGHRMLESKQHDNLSADQGVGFELIKEGDMLKCVCHHIYSEGWVDAS